MSKLNGSFDYIKEAYDDWRRAHPELNPHEVQFLISRGLRRALGYDFAWVSPMLVRSLDSNMFVVATEQDAWHVTVIPYNHALYSEPEIEDVAFD